MSSRVALTALLVVALAACSTQETPRDYTAFLRHDPRSILVLPPINTTADVEASDLFLATVTQPLAEQGYYVFPILVVDQVMKSNGAPTPGDMHSVSWRKLGEIFGADAVLYVVINDWNTSYIGIATTTRVRINYRLVDIRTGHVLWSRMVSAGESSAQYASEGPLGMVVSVFMAQVQAIGAAVSDPEVKFARKANWRAFQDSKHGLLPGPRHPAYATDPRRVKTAPQL